MTLASMASAAGALACVLLIIGLGTRFLPLARLLPVRTGAGGRLGLLGTLPLDSRRRLLLVECDGRSVLILTGQQDVVVGWLPDGRA